MTKIEFFATVKVVCEHNEQGYWSDLQLEDVKQTAIGLMQPNFNTEDCGVSLKSVDFKFHDDENKSVDAWNFGTPDVVFVDKKK